MTDPKQVVPLSFQDYHIICNVVGPLKETMILFYGYNQMTFQRVSSSPCKLVYRFLLKKNCNMIQEIHATQFCQWNRKSRSCKRYAAFNNQAITPTNFLTQLLAAAIALTLQIKNSDKWFLLKGLNEIKIMIDRNQNIC